MAGEGGSLAPRVLDWSLVGSRVSQMLKRLACPEGRNASNPMPRETFPRERLPAPEGRNAVTTGPSPPRLYY